MTVHNRKCPYAPPTTVLSVVDRFRNRGLQTPITKEVLLRAGVSESLAPRTLATLKQLVLIDNDGQPTDMFEGIAKATEAELTAFLANWVRTAYADVFAFVDPSEDDAMRIRDAFRGYAPRAQQGRMATLFIGLCEAAGIVEAPTEGSTEHSKRRAAAPTRKTKRQAKSTSSRAESPVTSQAGPTWTGGVAKIGTPHGYEPLVGLIGTLPSGDEGWTELDRTRFMAAFEAVLDFVVPIREPAQESPEVKERHSPTIPNSEALITTT